MLTPIEFRESLKPILSLPERSSFEKKDILLIPIFNAFECTVSYAKMAAYALYSFLANSDLIEQNVDVKLYIEEKALDSVSEVLKENQICLETDVMAFKWQHRDYYSISQKLHTLLDDRLLSYENVFVADTDTFIFPSVSGDRLSLFSTLKNEHRALCSIIPQEGTTLLSLLSACFYSFFTGKPRADTFQDLQRDVLLSPMMNLKLNCPVHVPTTWLFMFKPCLLRHEYPTFGKWFDDYGYCIYTDEEVLGIGSLLGHIAFGTDLAHRHSVKIGSLKTQEACIRHGEMDHPDDIEEFYRRIL